ncbi:SCO family protein [Guyparkeria sp.]|uniref:SCO family protein n=1 Tax=Guyparkeria sp. TaxID=2035736 RepID=UPI0039709921
MTNANRRQWIILLSLAAIFILPLAASWTMYTLQPFEKRGGLEHGELITPAEKVPVTGLITLDGEPVDASLFQGKWTLLYHVPASENQAGCDADCRALMDTLRRVRLAQDEGMRVVQRVLLEPAGTGQPADFDPGLQVLESNQWPLARGSVYVVDRQGYLVLRYDAGFDPQGLLKDLERLLRLAGEG